MSLNRAGSRFRASGTTRRVACVGGCGAMVRTAEAWVTCLICTDLAWAWLRPQLPRVGSEARRPAVNRFWGSESAVRAAVEQTRAKEGVSA